MKLDASVVWIRNGKTHELKDKNAILAGKTPLMVKDKVFVDVNLYADDGSDAEDVEAGQIHYSLGYNDKTDIGFTGEGSVEDVKGSHWLLGGQGQRKVGKASGNAVVVRLVGGTMGPARNASYIEVSVPHLGLSDRIIFPWTD